MELYRDEKWVLSTGKIFLAQQGVRGLSPDPQEPANSAGVYSIVAESTIQGAEEANRRPFTRTERQEIAHFMIGLWFQWIDQECE